MIDRQLTMLILAATGAFPIALTRYPMIPFGVEIVAGHLLFPLPL